MGLLNKMLNIVGEGLAKSASDALGKAVTKAVKPAAEKFAEKQADLIDAVTKKVEEGTEAVNAAGDALNEAGKAADSAASNVDSEQMKMALEYLRQNARMAAEEIKNIEQEEKPADEEVLAQWETLLPDYPVYSCGGTEFEFEKTTFGLDDKPSVALRFSGCEAYLLAYEAKLIANGFCPKYPGSSTNQEWYKQIGDRYITVFFDEVYDSTGCTLCFYDDNEKDILKARHWR